MSRLLVAALVATSAVGGFALATLVPDAHAAGPKVVCQPVLQVSAGINEQVLANFMAEQLAQGRERFTTVQGISTVICAY
jgi:hypothetical protein